MTTDRKGRVLVVDDSPQIRKFLRISLSAHGYEVVESHRGEDALKKCTAHQPDIVVLDLGLPDIDGQEVIRRIREWSRVPILVLSVRSGENEKVRSLESGANDYVTKPFGIAELLARVGVLLRDRAAPGTRDEAVFATGGLEIDYAARCVKVDGRQLRLTRKEFDLLRLLARQAGKVLTHERLLGDVWGPGGADKTHYLRVHIGHLRQKLGEDPDSPRFIWTEPGVGYRLIVEA